jgi:hypothetical protein
MVMTYLAEIAAGIEERKPERPNLKINAIKSFAKLNDWYFSRKGFELEELARKHGWKPYPNYSAYYRYQLRMQWQRGIGTRIWDHSVYFRKGQRIPAAVALQPYHVTSIEIEKAKLNEAGLDIYIPPIPKASFHYPGETFMLLIAPIGININWLPEQVSE